MLYLPPLEPPPAALVSLVDHRYGFCFVDVGITSEDMAYFDALEICKNHELNHFGEIASLQENVAAFLSEIGTNETEVVERAARRIHEIAIEIIKVSGRETAWVCMRASLPNSLFDIPRWHFDGKYYAERENYPQYKFAMALRGASTLFYPMPKELTELRRVIRMHMSDRKFTQELFRAEDVVSPPKGMGAFFIAGDANRAAFHSEPPIHESRLFFFWCPVGGKNWGNCGAS